MPLLSCCGTQPGPEPIQEFDLLVQERVNQWLDPRMDADSWDTFKSQESEWSEVLTLTALVNWFKDNLGDPSGTPALWDFGRFIQQLKDSSLYQERGPPSDAELLGLLINALKTYKYES